MSDVQVDKATPVRTMVWVAAMLCLSGAAPASPAAQRAGEAVPTRAELDATRRRVDRLEAEQVLGATRRPYLVLDLETRILSYRMMGMDLREIPLDGLSARGLQPAPRAAEPDAVRVAGIFSLREKSGDPRLKPMTPEQIEAGLDDENVADALPPEPPVSFTLRFQQPVLVTFEAGSNRHRVGAAVSFVAARIKRRFGRGETQASHDNRLVLSLQVERTTAAEIYRSLIPGLRFLLLPPTGMLLPEAGQEAPRSIRPARPAPRPTPRPRSPLPPPPGVPFQIPQPVPTDPGESPGAVRPVVPTDPGGETTPIPGSEAAPIPAIRIEPRGTATPAEPQPTPQP